MNIRILAALAAIVVMGGVSAQAADEDFASQVQEVSMLTVNPEVAEVGYQGVDGNSSWAAIQARGLKAKQPKITIGNTSYSISMFCKDGDALRSVKPVRRCTDWNHRERSSECEAWSTGYVSKAITGPAQFCAKWRESGGDRDRVCTRWETVTRTIPLSYDIEVVRLSGREDNETVVFTKPYTVPSCQ